jgi:type I restriction enzyme S subunit
MRNNINKIPNQWVWTTMGEISTVVGGGTPKTSENDNFESGQIPWLTPADLSGYTAKYIGNGARNITEKGLNTSSARLMPAGTVLFTSRAPIGYVAIAKNTVSTNQGFKSFILHSDEILPDYVYWYLKGNKELAESFASGTTFLELSGSKAKQIPIPIAPINEQKRIVAEIEKQFSRLDEAVENLKRVKANLKRYKAAVLKAAVEGKLTEKWRAENPDVEPASELLERILTERRKKWEEAELAKMKAKGKVPKDDKWKKRYKDAEPPKMEETYKIPETWVWTNVGQLSWSVKDGPHYSPKYSKTGIPFISGGNIRPEGIDFSTAKFISPALHAELSERCKPEFGDLLYTKGGTTGIARINTEKREFNVWVHVAVLKLVDSIDRSYFQHALNSLHCYKQSQKYTHGVGNQDLGLTRMIWITLPLPPLKEQTLIVRLIEDLSSVVTALERQADENLKRADRLRESILKKAFSGQLVSQDQSDEPVAKIMG